MKCFASYHHLWLVILKTIVLFSVCVQAWTRKWLQFCIKLNPKCQQQIDLNSMFVAIKEFTTLTFVFIDHFKHLFLVIYLSVAVSWFMNLSVWLVWRKVDTFYVNHWGREKKNYLKLHFLRKTHKKHCCIFCWLFSLSFLFISNLYG